MPALFTVSGPNVPVKLNVDRRGRCQIAVHNVSGRPLRIRLRVVPLDLARKEWLVIAAEPERDFAVDETRQFPVDISVPASATPGAYSFRPEAIGVANPDEQFAQGAAVSFRVEPSPIPKPQGKGYLVTALGALAGSLVGGIIGTLPGSLGLIELQHLKIPPPPPADTQGGCVSALISAIILGAITVFLAALFPILLLILGVGLGLWAGPVAGAWIALRMRAYPRPGRTAAFLAVLQPIWIVVLLIVFFKLFPKGSGIAALVGVLFYLLCALVPALPARALALLGLARR